MLSSFVVPYFTTGLLSHPSSRIKISTAWHSMSFATTTQNLHRFQFTHPTKRLWNRSWIYHLTIWKPNFENLQTLILGLLMSHSNEKPLSLKWLRFGLQHFLISFKSYSHLWFVLKIAQLLLAYTYNQCILYGTLEKMPPFIWKAAWWYDIWNNAKRNAQKVWESIKRWTQSWYMAYDPFFFQSKMLLLSSSFVLPSMIISLYCHPEISRNGYERWRKIWTRCTRVHSHRSDSKFIWIYFRLHCW